MDSVTSRFLSKQEAARYLGVSIRSLEKLIAKGEIAPYRLTSKALFSIAELDTLAERHRSPISAKPLARRPYVQMVPCPICGVPITRSGYGQHVFNHRTQEEQQAQNAEAQTGDTAQAS